MDMGSTIIAPELEMFPDRYRWKVEECYRLMDLGILEGRFEVLDGEVIRKMDQRPPHAITLTRLLRLLALLVGLERLRCQSPISLEPPDSIYSEPEPDINEGRI